VERNIVVLLKLSHAKIIPTDARGAAPNLVPGLSDLLEQLVLQDSRAVQVPLPEGLQSVEHVDDRVAEVALDTRRCPPSLPSDDLRILPALDRVLRGESSGLLGRDAQLVLTGRRAECLGQAGLVADEGELSSKSNAAARRGRETSAVEFR